MDAICKVVSINELKNIPDSTYTDQKSAEKNHRNGSFSFVDVGKQLVDQGPNWDNFVLDKAFVDGFAQCIRPFLSEDANWAGAILQLASVLGMYACKHTESAYVLKTVGWALYESREELVLHSEESLLDCLTGYIRALSRLDPGSFVALFPHLL